MTKETRFAQDCSLRVGKFFCSENRAVLCPTRLTDHGEDKDVRRGMEDTKLGLLSCTPVRLKENTPSKPAPFSGDGPE